MDKALFKSDNVVTLKDVSRGFPVNQPVGVLRWRYIAKDESSIPLTSEFACFLLWEGRGKM